MFKNVTQRGFTLIELLVVIAIIGILAATVLASLGNARQSGSDASMQSSMNSMKSQAELIYTGSSNSYASVCTGTGATSTEALRIAINKNAEAGTVACNSNGNAWAMSAGLKNGGYFCADSTGFSGKKNNALTQATNPSSDAQAKCPAS